MKTLVNFRIEKEALKSIEGGLTTCRIFPMNVPEGIEIQVGDAAVSALQTHVNAEVVS